MSQIKSKFIEVRQEEELDNRRTHLMCVNTKYIGMANRFTNKETGEERRKAFFQTYNPELTGKADGYRVYVTIVTCLPDAPDDTSPEELRALACQMANHYVEHYLPGNKALSYLDEQK